eukprot:6214830-Pleurochrysis_carterae.AAC.6
MYRVCNASHVQGSRPSDGEAKQQTTRTLAVAAAEGEKAALALSDGTRIFIRLKVLSTEMLIHCSSDFAVSIWKTSSMRDQIEEMADKNILERAGTQTPAAGVRGEALEEGQKGEWHKMHM